MWRFNQYPTGRFSRYYRVEPEEYIPQSRVESRSDMNRRRALAILERKRKERVERARMMTFLHRTYGPNWRQMGYYV